MAKNNSFQWRAMVSTLMALTFLALGVSGTILFIAPPGRIANWTDWQIIGLTKSTWAGLHIWFATLFLGLTGVHLYFNWRPLMSYLRKRRGQVSGIRWEGLSSAGVAFAIFLGTTFAVPPFVNFLDLQETIKESWDEPSVQAPIPHAELLTIAELAAQAQMTPEKALERLAAAGLTELAADAVTSDVAEANGITAQAVYKLLAPAAKGSAKGSEPKDGQKSGAGGGMGYRTLTEFCNLEGISIETALTRLDGAGLTADASDTLREIAQRAEMDRPYDVIQVLRSPATP